MLQGYFASVIISSFGTRHYIFSTARFFDKVPGWNEWELWYELQRVQVAVMESFFYFSSKRCLLVTSIQSRVEWLRRVLLCYNHSDKIYCFIKQKRRKICKAFLKEEGLYKRSFTYYYDSVFGHGVADREADRIFQFCILKTTYKPNHNMKIFHFFASKAVRHHLVLLYYINCSRYFLWWIW